MNEWLFKICQTGRSCKNKQKITYLLIAANFFLLFSFYYCVYFLFLFLYQSFSVLQLDTNIVLVAGQRQIKWDKKQYHETKNDTTGQKAISQDISFLWHCVITLIKAQVCDKLCYVFYVIQHKNLSYDVKLYFQYSLFSDACKECSIVKIPIILY